jgi:hypothetical protein
VKTLEVRVFDKGQMANKRLRCATCNKYIYPQKERVIITQHHGRGEKAKHRHFDCAHHYLSGVLFVCSDLMRNISSALGTLGRCAYEDKKDEQKKKKTRKKKKT